MSVKKGVKKAVQPRALLSAFITGGLVAVAGGVVVNSQDAHKFNIFTKEFWVNAVSLFVAAGVGAAVNYVQKPQEVGESDGGNGGDGFVDIVEVKNDKGVAP